MQSLLRHGAACGLLLGLASSVESQPANDAFANAEVVAAVPFEAIEPAQQTATSAADDPAITCRASTTLTADALRGAHSLWYRFAPSATDYYNLSTVGSAATVDTMIGVFVGDSPAALRLVVGGCSDDQGADGRSLIAGLRLSAGETYRIVVARSVAVAQAGELRFAVTVAPRHVVTKRTDSADGTCDADCSLREAIGAANATPGAVLLEAGTHALTINGNEDANLEGDLDVRNAMALYGVGSAATTIGQAIGNQRVMHLPTTNALAVHLHDLAIAGGTTPGAGGGIGSTGSTRTTIALDHVRMVDNFASLTGGALHANGAAQIADSWFTGSGAQGSGGAVALLQPRFVEVTRSTFSDNITYSSTTLEGGGAIASNGVLRVVNSTFSGNQARSHGGALYVIGANGSLGLYNTTVADNAADADFDGVGTGGGLRIEGASTSAHPIEHGVIADNVVRTSADATVPSDCSRTAGASAIASRYSFIETANPACPFSGEGDVTGVDPMLLPTLEPAPNGTAVRPLRPGSPVIDAGDPVDGCRDPAGRPVTVDQRDAPRPEGSRCDPGAYEGAADVAFSDSFE